MERRLKVFITGVAGFLGSHLADAMLAKGHEVVGVDNLLGGDIKNVNQRVEFYPYDIRDLQSMTAEMAGCELVYHCAATAYEGLSVFSPHMVVDNILSGSTSVFTAAVINKVRRVVFCSSMARYGRGEPPFKESDTPTPQDPYGIAKLAAEQVLFNLAQVHGFEAVVAVPHNIIGARQKYDDPFRNVASIMANMMLQGRQPIIYGDGTQKRCFSHVDDCLSCLIKLGLTPDPPFWREINIGPDEGAVTINELAELTAALLGWRPGDLHPVYVTGRPQEVKHAVCSSDRARAVLGYKTTVSLPTGIQTIISHIQANGVKPFVYHLPIEINSAKTPITWTQRLF